MDDITPSSQLLIYQTPSGDIKIDVRLESETVWLTKDHMAEHFGKSKSTINEHIKNIFAKGELVENNVMKKFASPMQSYISTACRLLRSNSSVRKKKTQQ